MTKRTTSFGLLAPALAIVISLLMVSAALPARADVEYDFVYVDAFQSGYDLKECYLFDVNNLGQACGWATDLPSYAGFYWSVAADKTRLPFTLARGINDIGQVAGHDQVFDIVHGTTTTIPLVPGAPARPVALDINDQGMVVGYAETCICSNSNRTLQIPFIWDPIGGSRSIPVPGAKELVKINNSNVAVGVIRGGSPDGFVYEIATGRTIRLSTYLPTNPFPWTEAAAINDLGMVTGRHRSNDAQSFHGFVWTEAAGATLLPHLAGNPLLDVYPWAINDAGAVVGMAEIENHVWHAFLWDAQEGLRDLNALAAPPPGFILDRAIGINDRGWIVGDGHFGPSWSSSQAFVLIPRTESTLDVPPMAAGRLALRLRPNPTHGPATIDYVTERDVPVRIGIFDLNGRKVVEMAGPGAPAGARVARWDGRDASGRPVAPGAYLVRIEAAGQVRSRMIAVVR
jgi:probable HAF family extracellular repeat protein